MNTCNTKTAPNNYNKYAYILFVILSIVFACLKDFSTAFVYWGLALIFDPFNSAVAFHQRPGYQRWWLLVHVCIAVVTLALLFFLRR